MPVISFMLAVLSGSLELLYRINDLGELPIQTSIVNWGSFTFFMLLSYIVPHFSWAGLFVCPWLTCITYYYFAIVDYDGTILSIYYTLIIGITTTFFILVTFNERWLLSTIFYSPCLYFYMEKTGSELSDGEESNELYLRSFFAIFVYAVIAFKVETLAK